MDTTSVQEVAAKLGVNRSRVTRACRGGEVGCVTTPQGRGLPATSVAALTRRWGAVPSRPTDLTRDAMLILALLAGRPRGLPSARSMAALLGMSPTTVSATLDDLAERGLVRRHDVVVPHRGRARRQAWWRIDWRSRRWDALLEVVQQVTLPSPPPCGADDGHLPPSLWHLVWNGDPAAVELRTDGEFIAGRILDDPDPEALAWAARSLPAAALRSAASQRGRTTRDRLLAELLIDA